ncbi:hypothetical protein QBD00_003421 [Ochrobactrum sp. AN78]|nr:hypothetical protein [Ochrobactrum sp. AN78]
MLRKLCAPLISGIMIASIVITGMGIAGMGIARLVIVWANGACVQGQSLCLDQKPLIYPLFAGVTQSRSSVLAVCCVAESTLSSDFAQRPWFRPGMSLAGLLRI